MRGPVLVTPSPAAANLHARQASGGGTHAPVALAGASKRAGKEKASDIAGQWEAAEVAVGARSTPWCSSFGRVYVKKSIIINNLRYNIQ